MFLIAGPLSAAERLLDAAAAYVWLEPMVDGTISAGLPAEDFNLTLGADTGYALSLTFFIGKGFAAELAAASIETSAKLTAVDDDPRPPSRPLGIVPITATLQYHFAPSGVFDPYIGVGAIFVRVDDPTQPVEDPDVEPGLGVIEVESEEIGYVISGGLNVEMTETIGVILDVKYVPGGMPTRAVVNIPSGASTEFDMNPVMVSLGVSYRWGR
jgi:outer membrane protein W